MPADQVPLVIAALPGGPGDDVIAKLSANARLVIADERAWLRSIGIEPGYRSELHP